MPASYNAADLRAYAYAAATKYGVDPRVFLAQIQQESHFDPIASNPSGASGIAQFMPGTAQQYGVDPSDPYSSLDGAARYMRDLLQQNNGDYRLALASYNWGPGNVANARGKLAAAPAETQDYVNSIMGGSQGGSPVVNQQYPTNTTLDPRQLINQYGGSPGRQTDPQQAASLARARQDPRYWIQQGFSPQMAAMIAANPQYAYQFGQMIDSQANLAQRQHEWDVPSGADRLTASQAAINEQDKVYDQNVKNALAQGNLDLARQIQADKNTYDQNAQQLMARGQDVTAADSQNQANVSMYGTDVQAQTAKSAQEAARYLGEQQNQTGQFGAETTRATGMGQLALANNKAIMDAASQPRNAFSMYFMQHGMAPDWANITGGGTVARGQSWAPSDPMHAYVPVTGAPGFGRMPTTAFNASGPGVHPALQGVGQYNPGQSYQILSPQQNAGAQGNIATGSQANASNAALIAAAGLGAQTNVPGTGAASVAGGPGAQPGYDFNANPSGLMAHGGKTHAKHFVAGDALGPNPGAGGALPEQIGNPTGAPLTVKPNPKTLALMHMLMLLGKHPNAQPGGAAPQMGMPPPPSFAGPPLPPGAPPQMAGQYPAPGTMPRYAMGTGFDAQHAAMVAYGMHGNWPHAHALPTYFADRYPPQAQPMDGPHYAIGTALANDPTVQNAYQQAGMGGYYMPSMAHQDTTGMAPNVAALANYGMPITPGLNAATTGQSQGRFNVADAFSGAGGGTLTSLQQLNRMNSGQRDLYQGYAQGVTGIPWNDLTDYLTQATSGLGSAKTAQVAA